MRCNGMKKIPNKDRTKNCGRQAKIFFRVKYSHLWRDNGVYEDVMGFCEECARDKHTPSGYGYDGTRWGGKLVLRRRGDVSSVEPDNGSSVEDEKLQLHMNDAKRNFLRVMCTQKNAALADHWPEVFKMAWDEFRLMSVMSK
jgi:hypothetical protein